MNTVNTPVLNTKKLMNLQRLVRLINDTENIPLKDLLGDEGNQKIPSSTAIFNMTSAKSCSSMKLGLCKASAQSASCYARKAEILYPNVLPYREKQAKLWKNITAEDFAKQFLLINLQKVKSFCALRMNESGDFVSQECINKAERIATILKRQGITTYCYTSRSDLDFSKVKNLIISGSNFKKKGITSVFKIIQKKEDKPFGWASCRMDCKKCKLCQMKNQKITVVKH